MPSDPIPEWGEELWPLSELRDTQLLSEACCWVPAGLMPAWGNDVCQGLAACQKLGLSQGAPGWCNNAQKGVIVCDLYILPWVSRSGLLCVGEAEETELGEDWEVLTGKW